jgi:hypothetical protein
MRCWECRLEFDEINESQPVCPGCGQPPNSHRDHPDFSGFFDEAQTLELVRACEAEEDDVFDATGELDDIRLPVDLLEAADDAEALLEATGLAAFHLPDGFRLFRLPTERVM